MKKLIPKEIPDECIRALARAICAQAGRDYKAALKKRYTGKINKYDKSDPPLETPEQIERFFRSDWFKLLSGIEDPERGIENIRWFLRQRATRAVSSDRGTQDQGEYIHRQRQLSTRKK